jgi:hypothetical protein
LRREERIAHDDARRFDARVGIAAAELLDDRVRELGLGVRFGRRRLRRRFRGGCDRCRTGRGRRPAGAGALATATGSCAQVLVALAAPETPPVRAAGASDSASTSGTSETSTGAGSDSSSSGVDTSARAMPAATLNGTRS